MKNYLACIHTFVPVQCTYRIVKNKDMRRFLLFGASIIRAILFRYRSGAILISRRCVRYTVIGGSNYIM